MRRHNFSLLCGGYNHHTPHKHPCTLRGYSRYHDPPIISAVDYEAAYLEFFPFVECSSFAFEGAAFGGLAVLLYTSITEADGAVFSHAEAPGEG